MPGFFAALCALELLRPCKRPTRQQRTVYNETVTVH